MEFTLHGKKVYYEVHGKGKTLIILNGIMMSTASWKAFVDDFSANNKVVLVDFFDQGQSARMNEPYDHGLQVLRRGGISKQQKPRCEMRLGFFHFQV